MKPSQCPAKDKKKGKKSERRVKGRKRKVKVKTAVSLLTPPPPQEKTSFRQEIVEWIPQGKSSCSPQADQDEGKWKALTLACH